MTAQIIKLSDHRKAKPAPDVTALPLAMLEAYWLGCAAICSAMAQATQPKA
jgi:hypothetical protein